MYNFFLCGIDQEFFGGVTLIIHFYQVDIQMFLLVAYYYDLPGRGMCMPGKGTLKGGTMTGGKAGRAAVGWATL